MVVEEGSCSVLSWVTHFSLNLLLRRLELLEAENIKNEIPIHHLNLVPRSIPCQK